MLFDADPTDRLTHVAIVNGDGNEWTMRSAFAAPCNGCPSAHKANLALWVAFEAQVVRQQLHAMVASAIEDEAKGSLGTGSG